MLESLGVKRALLHHQVAAAKDPEIHFRHECGAPGDTPDLTRAPKLRCGYCGQHEDHGATTYTNVSVLLFADCIPACTVTKPIRLKRRMNESLDHQISDGMS